MGWKKFALLFIASMILIAFVLQYPSSSVIKLANNNVLENGALIVKKGVNIEKPLKTVESIVRNNSITATNSKDNRIYQISPMAYNYYVVPNIVHFVWFNRHRRPMEFTEMLSILSAHKYQRPDALLMHCNFEPRGKWWLELMSKVSVEVIHREIPPKAGRYNISDLHHARDIAKLQILMEYGGIALDVDVIVLNSLNNLRFYNFTMGKEKAPKLSNSIIIARNDSEFLHRWYRSYEEDYKPSISDYNSCTMPFKIAQRHVDWIHIEPTRLTTPDWMDKHLLYVFSNSNLLLAWRKLYVVHLMFNDGEGRIYNPVYIKALRNLVGKILRLVYYGSEDEQSEFVPWVYYSKHPMTYGTDNKQTSTVVMPV